MNETLPKQLVIRRMGTTFGDVPRSSKDIETFHQFFHLFVQGLSTRSEVISGVAEVRPDFSRSIEWNSHQQWMVYYIDQGGANIYTKLKRHSVAQDDAIFIPQGMKYQLVSNDGPSFLRYFYAFQNN